MNADMLRRIVIGKSAIMFAIALFCSSTIDRSFADDPQNALEQPKKQAKSTKEEIDLLRQQVEKDKQTIAAAHQALGAMAARDINLVKRLEEKRKHGTRFNRWEINNGMLLAPKGTMLHDVLKEPKNVDETNLTTCDDHVLNAISVSVAASNVSLTSKLKQIDDAKDELKRAMLADDKASITRQTAVVSKYQDDVSNVLKMPFPSITPSGLKRWTVGRLTSCQLVVAEVLDDNTGEAEGFLTTALSSSGIHVRVTGLDSFKLAHNKKIDFLSKEIFVVGEKVESKSTHPSLDGSDCIEIHGFGSIQPFDQKVIAIAQDAISAKYDLTFTDDETQKMKYKVEQNKIGLNQRRSLSFLESGKILLKNGNKAAAKKQFEKVIAEDSDSDAAKEAKTLLERIQ